MAVVARFTKPIQVVTTPEQAKRCKVIADREGVSLASVYRDLIARSLPEREQLSVARAS